MEVHRPSNRARSSLAIALCCIVTSIASMVCASDDGAPESPQILLSGEVELARLIDLCAERLGLNIEYDAGMLKGTVTLRLGGGLSDDELWLLTNRLLASRGMASVRAPGRADGSAGEILSIVKLNEASKQARLEPFDAAPPPLPGAGVGAGYVMVIARVKHQPAKDVIGALKQVLSTGGSVTELGETDLILISDLRPRVDEAMRVMELIDVPVDPPLIETIPAQHLPATQLASLVTAAATSRDAMSVKPLGGKVTPVPDGSAVILIAPPEETGIWRDLIARFDERQALVTRSYTPRHFAVSEVSRLIDQVARDTSPRGAGDRWKIVADDLTGTLIVTATPGEHERIVELVERLDAAPDEARRGVRTFLIRNRDVNDVMETVTQIADTGVFEAVEYGDGAPTAGGEPPLNRRNGTPPGLHRPESMDQGGPRRGIGSDLSNGPSLLLTADEGTNTLIAFGESRVLGQLEELIATLDVRQPQVMIETMVVNLSEGETLDLGVELEKLEISGSTLIRLSSLFGLGGVDALASEALPGAGRGFTGVALSPGDFSIVIRALETVNAGRSMSLPKTLVNNNEQATLDSVLEEPFTSTNASTTVATTSFGGSSQAGTQISVTPQIAAGDHIILEYSVSLSTFVGESSDPSLPPPRQQNTLQSKVTIPDGYTVVLGGLEVTQEAEATSKVPLLADVPVLGELFKNRSRSNSRSRFFVFIRADVMRHAGFEDLKYISDRDKVAAGIDDGWPQVDPRVIR